MTNITAIALEVDNIAKFVHEDPYELWRAAVSGERIMILTHHDVAVDEVERMIEGLSEFEIARIDRAVWGS